jgi:hypothetical protein
MSTRVAWAARLLVAVVRVVLVMLAVQASGLPHLVADTIAGDAADHSSPCPDDDKSCPPGCPSCHVCGHMQAVFVPRMARLTLTSRDVEMRRSVMTVARPPAAPSSSLFRPPRA